MTMKAEKRGGLPSLNSNTNRSQNVPLIFFDVRTEWGFQESGSGFTRAEAPGFRFRHAFPACVPGKAQNRSPRQPTARRTQPETPPTSQSARRRSSPEKRRSRPQPAILQHALHQVESPRAPREIRNDGHPSTLAIAVPTPSSASTPTI